MPTSKVASRSISKQSGSGRDCRLQCEVMSAASEKKLRYWCLAGEVAAQPLHLASEVIQAGYRVIWLQVRTNSEPCP